jgi:hypothetical protein
VIIINGILRGKSAENRQAEKYESLTAGKTDNWRSLSRSC